MSAQQFMEMLFGKLPEFFKDEAELRAHLERARHPRKAALHGLAEKGFGREQLAEMQKIIDAEKSDLFDVLAYVAYATPPLTREERAARRRSSSQQPLQRKQTGVSRLRAGSHYVSDGADELDRRKADAAATPEYTRLHRRRPGRLGSPGEIREVFVGFQKYLYQQQQAQPTHFKFLIPKSGNQPIFPKEFPPEIHSHTITLN